jgi:alpha-tubulin suppressor-like RCC1 family protein
MLGAITALALFGVVGSAAALGAGTTPTGFGQNSLGAFGAPISDGPTAVQVVDEAGSTQASMGCSHAVYLHPDGTVWASGWNSWGQLGDGNSTDTTTATEVPGLSDVVQVAAGCYHSLALKADGTVWMWGQTQGVTTSNPPDGSCPGFGGGGSVQCFVHPTQWVGPTNITQIAAGTEDEIALSSDGTVYTGGQIGIAHLTLPNPVTDVAMQSYQAEAITSDGKVYAWGDNQAQPTLVQGIEGSAVSLGGGMLSGYAVTRDGSVWAWGDDRYGQLGDQGTTAQPTAIKVPGLPAIVAVAGGFWHAVALDASGGVWAWGDNVDGEVGPQQPQNVDAAPSKIPNLGPVTEVSAGGYSTLVLVGAAKPVATSMAAKPAVVDLSPLTSSKHALPTLYLWKLTATLTTATGAAVPGEVVQFYAKNKLLCSAPTNGAGTAMCNALTTNGVIGTVEQNGYTASFAGGDGYAASGANGPLLLL